MFLIKCSSILKYSGKGSPSKLYHKHKTVIPRDNLFIYESIWVTVASMGINLSGDRHCKKALSADEAIFYSKDY